MTRGEIGDALNCPNCGAPINGDKCEYCGTTFIDTTMELDKPFYIKYRVNSDHIVVMKALLRHAELRSYSDDIEYYDMNNHRCLIHQNVYRDLDMSFSII